MASSIHHNVRQIDTLPDAQLSARIAAAGLCSNTGTDEWFPLESTGECGRQEYEQAARDKCGPCPAIHECLLLALRYESRKGITPHGIWGGTAPWQRQDMLRKLARKSGSVADARRALGVAA